MIFEILVIWYNKKSVFLWDYLNFNIDGCKLRATKDIVELFIRKKIWVFNKYLLCEKCVEFAQLTLCALCLKNWECYIDNYSVFHIPEDEMYLA